MKYTTEVTINLPRQRMIELFDDPANLSKWQPGLKSFEPISGQPGQPGAKSRLVYDMEGRIVEMIETVTVRALPDEFSGTYEAAGVWNGMVNHFYEDGNQTRWVAEVDFRFSGFMALMSLFMGGTFRKQTRETMEHFKTFAESA